MLSAAEVGLGLGAGVVGVFSKNWHPGPNAAADSAATAISTITARLCLTIPPPHITQPHRDRGGGQGRSARHVTRRTRGDGASDRRGGELVGQRVERAQERGRDAVAEAVEEGADLRHLRLPLVAVHAQQRLLLVAAEAE